MSHILIRHLLEFLQKIVYNNTEDGEKFYSPLYKPSRYIYCFSGQLDFIGGYL